MYRPTTTPCGNKRNENLRVFIWKAYISYTVLFILALMLLAFTTRRMVRSAHLALSLKRFTVQFFVTQIDIRTKKYILNRWVRRVGLISARVTT